MVVANRYAAQSRIFLRQAYEELGQGDLLQASEKGWGAAAQIVKAVAEDRGLDHGGHAELYAVVRQLRADSGINNLMNLFQTAGHLHFNFYEGLLDNGEIRESLDEISEFVDRLRAMLPTE